MLIRKAAFTVVALAAITAAAVFIGGKLPTSFLPEEDYGYVYTSLQLPNAASMERTSEVARQVEKIILDTPGVQGCTSVLGFSLLSRVQDTYSAFFFVTEKPWDERTKPEEQYTAIRSHITQRAKQDPRRNRFFLRASRDSGRRHQRRRHFHAGGPVRRHSRFPGC